MKYPMLVGPNGAAKLTLGPGLTLDALFGAGTSDAVNERRTLDPQTGWTVQSWYRKCVDTRAKAVSTLPWAIYPQGAENDAEPLWKDDDVATPEDLKVLDGLTKALYLAEASLSLTGGAYFGKVLVNPGERLPGSTLGRLSGLMYWQPGKVQPKFTQQGLMGFERTIGQQIVLVDPMAVLWIWQPDPFVEMGPGTGDGRAAGVGAAVLNSMARLLTRHMDSGLVKMTVLSLEDDRFTTPEQRSTLRQMWDRLLRKGVEADGGPPILNKVTPHTIGDGLKDLGSKDISSEQREAISTGFGLPWSILASSAANFATAQVEERGFYIRTAIPQARIIEHAFNQRLLNEYGLTLRFEPERHEVMQAWELEKAEKISSVTGRKPVLTRNEGRELLGYEIIPEWDAEDKAPPAPPPTFGGDGQDEPAMLSLKDRIAQIVGAGV